jgi:4,5-dihydroxyphthalate decarboxylase
MTPPVRNSANPRLALSIAVSSNPRTWPIIDGSVAVEGVDLACTVLHPSEMFWRQLHHAEFDISEMSCSSLMMARAHGDDRWVGIPVFTTRRFFHTGILVRRDAGIDHPTDLKGKRVAVPEYQQTAVLWTRGVLQHEWGVAAPDMEFWMERSPEQSHGGATGFKPPPGVTLHTIPPDKNIGTMMLSGEVHAALHYIVSDNLIDRSTADLWNHPEIKLLFPDRTVEGIRFYKKTGLYPINHGMVIKRSIAAQHPWVIENLLDAFNRANALANRQRMEHVADHLMTGLLPPNAKDHLQRPLITHGGKANRLVLETCARYSHEQGLTPRLMKLDEIFEPSTLER